jgi:gliding motility-associated-like protein
VWAASSPVWAEHLVGGEIWYDYLGNNRYRVTLRIYRDCNSSGATLDPQAAITAFDGATGQQVANFSFLKGPTIGLPASTGSPCLGAPPNICTEYADYVQVVVLPPRTNGYVLSHQRCCRNSTIDNLQNPSQWGNTFTVRIPPNGGNGNSSPRFSSIPPIVLCNQENLAITSGATDPDGDSLHYELCQLLHGGGQTNGSNCLTCPAPDPAAAPPYANVSFLGPQSFSAPIPGTPGISVNNSTGMLSGYLTTTGQYSIGICVSEYRNGVLLSTVSRDYQFNVTACDPNVSVDIVTADDDPTYLCLGTTIPFRMTSTNVQSVLWNFGVAGTGMDTSTRRTPIFTFPDTGRYEVMLIGNPGYPCADTDVVVFQVYPPIDPTLTHQGSGCFDEQQFVFTATGTWFPGVEFLYTFGAAGQATLDTFAGPSPPPISFAAPGIYPVRVRIRSKGCEAVAWDTVWVVPRPQWFPQSVGDTGCRPLRVAFVQDSLAGTPLKYLWEFGDGTTSTLPNPVHVYQTAGTYTVRTTVYADTACIDTIVRTFVQAVVVHPTPAMALASDRSTVSIYDPLVRFTASGQDPDETYVLLPGDGSLYVGTPVVWHAYADSGSFRAQLVVTNSLGCTDTAVVPIRVNPTFNVFVPSAFTPNLDNRNEAFRPVVTGFKTYEFLVLNRWGNVVFSTTDAQFGWNGRVGNTGAECPEGVYVWVVYVRDFADSPYEKRGTVTLLR